MCCILIDWRSLVLPCVCRWSAWNRRWSRKKRNNACWRSNCETQSGHGRMQRTATGFWRRRWKTSFLHWAIWPLVRGLATFDLCVAKTVLSGFCFRCWLSCKGSHPPQCIRALLQKVNKSMELAIWLLIQDKLKGNWNILRLFLPELWRKQIRPNYVVHARIISIKNRAVLTEACLKWDIKVVHLLIHSFWQVQGLSCEGKF